MTPEMEAIISTTAGLRSDIADIKELLTGMPRTVAAIGGTIPAIPMADWYAKRNSLYDDRTEIFCNGVKIMEVLHNEEFPELPAFVNNARLYWHYLREFLLMFRDHGARPPGQMTACFWNNGRPIAPEVVTEYRAAAAAIQAVKPLPGPPIAEPVEVEDIRVNLSETATAALEPAPMAEPIERMSNCRLFVWQFDDMSIKVSAERPIDHDTGEEGRLLGGLRVANPNQSAKHKSPSKVF